MIVAFLAQSHDAMRVNDVTDTLTHFSKVEVTERTISQSPNIPGETHFVPLHKRKSEAHSRGRRGAKRSSRLTCSLSCADVTPEPAPSPQSSHPGAPTRRITATNFSATSRLALPPMRDARSDSPRRQGWLPV